jgi:hypothetical protein
MRNLLCVMMMFLGTQIFAQATNAPQVKTDVQYCCTKCSYCSAKEGTCPHHKTTLVKGETEMKYCCGNCGFKMTPVKGKCPESTTSVMKEGTLYCVLCYDKGGKCPKCGTEMSTIEVSKKKMKKEKKK